MSSFAQMTSRVQSLVGSHALAITAIVGGFVNSRHRDLLESYDWSRRKNDILIATEVDKTAGTIDVTNASAAVVGTTTAFASTDVNRSLKIGSNTDSIWTVNTFTDTTHISLGDANGTAVVFPGTTATGQTYTMFTQRYSLGTAIEQIISVKYKRPLTETSEEFLDRLDPSRTATGDPKYFARASRDLSSTNDLVRIEIYPRPTSAVVINVKIQKAHTDLTSTQNPIVPSGPLQWYAAIDTCFYLAAKTKDEIWLALAAKYESQAARALEFELAQDARKEGVIQTVQDVVGGVPLGNTDWALDHDV